MSVDSKSLTRFSDVVSPHAGRILDRLLEFEYSAGSGGLGPNPFRARDLALGAKRKGIRLIVTLECTEARGLVCAGDGWELVVREGGGGGCVGPPSNSEEWWMTVRPPPGVIVPARSLGGKEKGKGGMSDFPLTRSRGLLYVFHRVVALDAGHGSVKQRGGGGCTHPLPQELKA